MEGNIFTVIGFKTWRSLKAIVLTSTNNGIFYLNLKISLQMIDDRLFHKLCNDNEKDFDTWIPLPSLPKEIILKDFVYYLILS
jgi:hypothetical protein